MMRVARPMLLMASAALVLGACKKKPVAEPPKPQPQPVEAAPTRPSAPAPAPRDTMEAHNAAVAKARAALLATIYFEYDADELRDDSKAILDEKIAILNANPNVKVRIAGHCDERGSDEYNIALGRRRAVAAKQYLTDRGISEARIETQSFGRERPAVPGTSEEAWSKNRRDEFEILAGGESLKPAK